MLEHVMTQNKTIASGMVKTRMNRQVMMLEYDE